MGTRVRDKFLDKSGVKNIWEGVDFTPKF